MKIKTGDTVRVPSLEEDWLVAYCDDGYVCCCGYPESLVKVGECVLVRSCTPDEERDLLVRLSTLNDSLGAYARRRLQAAG